MPTEKQKKIAELIIENSVIDSPMTGGAMLEKVGYSKSMSTAKVGDVLESIGVQEALEDLGFNESNAKKVVTEIMLNGEEDASARLKATDQVFKVHGTYAPDKIQQTNVNIDITPQALEIAKKYEQELNQLEDADRERINPSVDKE